MRETEVGSKLELDHFKSRSGGGDELKNLVYCCTTCNRLKGSFWEISSTEKRLLHPQRDDLSLHIHQEAGGLLTALTETGKFHLSRLRLNRLPLLALRRARSENARLREKLKKTQATQNLLAEQLRKLDEKIEQIYEEIIRLLSNK